MADDPQRALARLDAADEREWLRRKPRSWALVVGGHRPRLRSVYGVHRTDSKSNSATLCQDDQQALNVDLAVPVAEKRLPASDTDVLTSKQRTDITGSRTTFLNSTVQVAGRSEDQAQSQYQQQLDQGPS